MTTERYFVFYQGFAEGGELTVCGSVVVNSSHKLETAEQMDDLSDQLSEKVGQPVIIASLFHMCTIKEEKEAKTPLNPDKVGVITGGK